MSLGGGSLSTLGDTRPPRKGPFGWILANTGMQGMEKTQQATPSRLNISYKSDRIIVEFMLEDVMDSMMNGDY